MLALALASCSNVPTQEEVLADVMNVGMLPKCPNTIVLEAQRFPTELKALLVMSDDCVTRWRETMASSRRCDSPDDPFFYLCHSADGTRSTHVDFRPKGRVLVRLGAAQ